MATRSVGAIQIDLDAMIAKFDTNMDRANKRIDGIEKNSKKAAAASKKAADAAEKGWDRAGKAIKVVVAALGAVALGAAARRAFSALDAAADKVVDLGKKAKTLDIPVEQLSGLRFAAQESNVEFESLILMVSTAGRNLGEFQRTGAGPAAHAMKALNLELLDAAGNTKNVVDLLPEISQKLKRLDSNQQLSIAGKLFGDRQGVKFVQLLNDTENFVENLDIQRERAARLGVVFTDEQVQRLTAYTDALNRMSEAWFGVKVRVINAIAPELEDFLNLAASVMAAAPEIVESVLGAFNSDDPEAMKKLGGLGDALIDAMGVTGQAAGLVFTAAIYDVLGLAADAVAPASRRLGQSMVGGIYESVADLIEWLGNQPVLGLLRPEIMEAAGAARIFGKLHDLNAPAQSGSSIVSGMQTALTDDAGRALPHAMKEAGIAMGRAYENAGDEAERVFGILGKIRARSMDIAARGGLLGGGSGLGNTAPDEATHWEQLMAGINAGYDSLLIKSEEYANLGSSAIVTVSDTISGDLASALASGEVSLSNFGDTAVEVMEKTAESVLQLVLRFYLAQAVLGGLNLLPGVGPTAAAGGMGGGGIHTVAQKHGGAWLDGMPLTKYAQGGVVNRATLFPMRRGAGLMGEAGPEAILPLTRIGGDLGVRATGGGVVVQIIDQRQGGQPADVQESSGADGKRMIRVIIRDEVRKAIGDGAMDRAMGATYGVRRRGTPR
jgi:hypothetical protein